MKPLLALLFICSLASAQTIPLSINGAAKCAAARVGDNFTGVIDSACSVTPPPPTDPGAYTSAVITWEQTPEIARAVDVTNFWTVWGRVDPRFPPQGWPGGGGATVKAPDFSARYYRFHLGSLPLNPGTLSHVLKAVSYGKSPANLRAKFAVVLAGNPWPTGDATACYNPSKAFDDSTVLNLNPIVINAAGQIVSGVVNRYKCTVYIRQDNPALIQYDVLMDTIGNGVMSLSFN